MAVLGAPTLPTNQPWEYNVNQPTLTSGANLANLYGINYDETAIRNKFNAASKAEYATKKQEFQNTENSFVQNLYAQGNVAADAIRRASAPMATGAANAAINTNVLSALLNLQAKGSGAATELANQRNLLASQEAEAMTKNTVDAMNAANELKNQVMQSGLVKYGYDVQNNVGEMQFWAALDTAAKEMWASKYQADLARGAMWL